MKRSVIKIMILYVLSLITLVFAFNAHADFVTFYHNDATGSPIAATDEQGNVLWTERREPFGEPKLNQSQKENHRVDYTGHVYDKELGLHYQGRRYYDPVIGRFMSFDPVGFYADNIQSFNRYAYANNNPYRFYDPDGQLPLDYIGDGISISISATIYAKDPSFVNGLALAADVVLGAAPFVPAGIGLLRGAGKVSVAKGAQFSKVATTTSKQCKRATLDTFPHNLI